MRQTEGTYRLYEPVINAVLSSGLLGVSALGFLVIARKPVDLRVIMGVALLPILFAGLGRMVVMFRSTIWELECFTGFDWSRDGVIGAPEQETVRLVPVAHRGRVIDGVDERDLAFFVKAATGSGDHTQRSWTGRLLPSGRRCDNDYHAELCQVLKKAGVLVDHSERQTGRMVTRDANTILTRLGL